MSVAFSGQIHTVKMATLMEAHISKPDFQPRLGYKFLGFMRTRATTMNMIEMCIDPGAYRMPLHNSTNLK